MKYATLSILSLLLTSPVFAAGFETDGKLIKKIVTKCTALEISYNTVVGDFRFDRKFRTTVLERRRGPDVNLSTFKAFISPAEFQTLLELTSLSQRERSEELQRGGHGPFTLEIRASYNATNAAGTTATAELYFDEPLELTKGALKVKCT